MVQAFGQPPCQRNPSVSAARSRFARYRGEASKAERRGQSIDDGIISKLGDIFQKYLTGEARPGRALKELDLKAEDIYRFSLTLERFAHLPAFQRKTGLFLALLTGRSVDEEFHIQTHHLSKPVDKLGHGNAKSLVIDGDAGEDLGIGMESGSIIVSGNAGIKAGYRMKGGRISIGGDAADLLAKEMKGGTIVVGGDAGPYIGDSIEGGLVEIRGDAYGTIMIRGGAVMIRGDAIDAVIVNDGGQVHVEGTIFPTKEDLGPFLVSKKGRVYQKGLPVGKYRGPPPGEPSSSRHGTEGFKAGDREED